MALALDCFGIERQSASTGEPLPPAQQIASSSNNRAWPGVFYARNVLQDFFFVQSIIGIQQRTSGCAAVRQNQTNNYASRICYCVSSGPVVGDPHIKTLHGEHYTVLKQGTFLAWSFKTSTGPVEWQLFASYTGARSIGGGFGEIFRMNNPDGILQIDVSFLVGGFQPLAYFAV